MNMDIKSLTKAELVELIESLGEKNSGQSRCMTGFIRSL